MTQLAQATQVGFDVFGPQRVESLSQFFTPPALALRMVGSLGDAPIRTVLEPSCGLGALIKPMIARGCGRGLQASIANPMVITAVDVDARNIDWCIENIRDVATCRMQWRLHDYLTMPAPAERYDLSISNVPYNKDPDDNVALDGKFLGKMIDECERIITLIRTTSLNGAKRYEQVWRHCDGRDSLWIVRKVSACIARPNCGGDGGKIDFSVVKMSRRTEADGDKTLSCIDWW